jgi:uncharacterized protein YwgA
MKNVFEGTRPSTSNIDNGNEFITYDISLHEFILILFGLEPEKPIQSRVKIQKGLFLLLKELEKRGYKVQDPQFIPCRDGPYSFTLANALEELIWSNFIETKGEYGKESEEFKLTDKGKKETMLLIEEKIKEKDLKDLVTFRQSLDQFTVEGLIYYVSNKFPEMKALSRRNKGRG